MNEEIGLFITQFVKEIEEGNAGIFAGAGLSVPAGFISWKDLLRPFAVELKLDIDKEYDLVGIAQYHCNFKSGNRHSINQALINEFSQETMITENHKILARLPIGTYWTTNYDKQIEEALKSSGKIPDVKYTVNHLANTIRNRSAIVYKMHGDVDHPDQVIITKDDYERYMTNRGAFVNALSGDLVSKTFLFLGFSFTDPNLDYILSRIRITYKENQRGHYCIFKRIHKSPDQSDKDFQYAVVKQELMIQDLKRFNIKVLLVDDYSEITKILKKIEQLYRRKTIFISGSADNFEPWTQIEVDKFLSSLGKSLIDQNFKIATGVGLGVGNAILTGAIDAIYRNKKGLLEDRLLIRPFPQALNESERIKIWDEYRKDILNRAGIALFVLGNKKINGETVFADGVKKEFEIANELELLVVPIGATGSIAEELWEDVKANLKKYYPNASAELEEAFHSLGQKVQTLTELVPKIINFINLATKE